MSIAEGEGTLLKVVKEDRRSIMWLHKVTTRGLCQNFLSHEKNANNFSANS
jgi:hypothetical protein